MTPPPQVLRQFPRLPWRGSHYLGNRGGFSGACLWRLETAAGDFCLKAWPRDDANPQRLAQLHEWIALARRHDLDYLPSVLPSIAGPTWVQHDGRFWVITSWLPGVADFHVRPSATRLSAACIALARLHGVWRRFDSCVGTCPGVQRRLEALQAWNSRVDSGWRPDVPSVAFAQSWAESVWSKLPHWIADAAGQLRAWTQVRLPLHPCWCDPWHDHILFLDDRVTGLVDYGSVKWDHAAVDLARLLGSLVGADPTSWAIGLDAYSAVSPLTEAEQTLAAVLDRTGLVVAALKWLRWLYDERRVFESPNAVSARLQHIATRLEYAWRS